MKEELISIVVPVYNVEDYLQNCVNSIIKQTYKNLEIILVDDGATDSSAILCDNLSKKDKRIIVIHKKNGGLSDARNAGIDISTGKYLMFIDSDDYINIHMVEYLYKILKDNKADVSMCNYKYVYDQNENVNIIENKEIEIYDKYQSLYNLYNSYYYPRFVIACAKLYKKQIFDDLKYKNNVINEDEEIIHKIYAKCNKVVFSKNEYYYYYQRSSSITHNKSENLDILEHLKERGKYFENNNMNELNALNNYYIIIQMSKKCNLLKNKMLKKKTKKIVIDYYKKILKDNNNSLFHKIVAILLRINCKTLYIMSFINKKNR